MKDRETQKLRDNAKTEMSNGIQRLKLQSVDIHGEIMKWNKKEYGMKIVIRNCTQKCIPTYTQK